MHRTVQPVSVRLCALLPALALLLAAGGLVAQRRADSIPPMSDFVRSNLARHGGRVVVRPGVRRVISNQHYGPERNLLPIRAPIAFTPFSRVNPATGRAVNLNARIRLPNGREMTMREFYDALDQTEQQLNQRGYSIRDRATFANVRLNRAPSASGRGGRAVPTGRATTTPLPGAGRGAGSATLPPAPSGRPPMRGGSGRTAAARGGRGIDQMEARMRARIRGAPVSDPSFAGDPPAPPSATTQLEGNSTPGSITGEHLSFAQWATSFEVSVSDLTAFRLHSGANTHQMVWQVASEPFPGQAPDSYASWQSVPGLISSGTTTCGDGEWCTFSVQFSSLAGGPPAAPSRYFFVRVLPVWSANPGTLMGMPSNQVVVRYGPATPQLPIKLTSIQDQSHYAPRRFTHPEGERPDFQLWLDAETLKVSTARVNGTPVGLRGDAHMLLRGRIFNPAFLVDEAQPRNLEFTLVGATLLAEAGLDPATLGAGGNPVAPRARVAVIGADVAYPLVDQIGTQGQPLEVDCGSVGDSYNPEARAWVWLGPVPIEMWIGAHVDYAVTCQGRLESDPARVQFYAQPIASADVYGGAGVNVLVAWATLQAELTVAQERIYLEIDTDHAVAPFSGRHELSNALKGRIFFTAGFYYPCPPVEQVEKLVGWVTGDDEVPLCSTSIEQTLIDSPGTNVAAPLF
jgi:hypothetical protein